MAENSPILEDDVTMINEADLENAIKLRDRLKDILTFKKGLWDGDITFSFGSYKADISSMNKPLVLQILNQEEEILRAKLKACGVKLDQ